AAHAAAHRGGTDVEDGGFDAGILQSPGHLGQGGIGAAVFVRAAVDQEHIHGIASVSLLFLHNVWPRKGPHALYLLYHTAQVLRKGRTVMSKTCPNFSQKCGGCPLLAMPYPEQLAQKQAR